MLARKLLNCPSLHLRYCDIQELLRGDRHRSESSSDNVPAYNFQHNPTYFLFPGAQVLVASAVLGYTLTPLVPPHDMPQIQDQRLGPQPLTIHLAASETHPRTRDTASIRWRPPGVVWAVCRSPFCLDISMH